MPGATKSCPLQTQRSDHRSNHSNRGEIKELDLNYFARSRSTLAGVESEQSSPEAGETRSNSKRARPAFLSSVYFSRWCEGHGQLRGAGAVSWPKQSTTLAFIDCSFVQQIGREALVAFQSIRANDFLWTDKPDCFTKDFGRFARLGSPRAGQHGIRFLHQEHVSQAPRRESASFLWE